MIGQVDKEIHMLVQINNEWFHMLRVLVKELHMFWVAMGHFDMLRELDHIN